MFAVRVNLFASSRYYDQFRLQTESKTIIIEGTYLYFYSLAVYSQDVV